MDAYEALKETFDDLFQQAVEEGCYTEDEAAELVESLDIYSLLQVVRHNATTVYSYITQGRQERSFNYRGEDLFRQKASLRPGDNGDRGGYPHLGAVAPGRYVPGRCLLRECEL